MERRLAAILAADMVGYSRLMEADEPGTLTRLKALLRDIIEPNVAEHHGRVVKTTGDGFLVEFPSVVEAVQCGIEVGRANALRNADVPSERRIEFRIGINLGDIMAEGDDIYGDGVNVATRLENMAEPGGMCISGIVFNQVKNKMVLPVEDLGYNRVKNITEPVCVYRVLARGAVPRPRLVRWLHWLKRHRSIAAAILAILLSLGVATSWLLHHREPSPPISPEAALGLPVVRVLPFQNLTADPALDVVGKGIAEDLRNLLWNFPDVKIASAQEASTALSDADQMQKSGAQFIVEGTVRKTGQMAVITAQLIETGSGTEVHSDRFEESIADPVALEDAIAKELSDRFGGMTGDMRKAYERIAWSKADPDLTQYDYYVRGHMHHHRFTKKEVAIARGIWEAGTPPFPENRTVPHQALDDLRFRPFQFRKQGPGGRHVADAQADDGGRRADNGTPVVSIRGMVFALGLCVCLLERTGLSGGVPRKRRQRSRCRSTNRLCSPMLEWPSRVVAATLTRPSTG